MFKGSNIEKEPVTCTPTKETITIDEENQTWLKLHAEPFTDFNLKWDELYILYRHNMIQNMAIDEILRNWPADALVRF